MTAERWCQIEELFTQALECDVTEVPAFLKEACRGDEELRRELASLLACDRPDQQLINSIPIVCAIASDSDGDIARKHIGPYRVIRMIGRGGMGAVYLGLRDDDQ